MAKAIYRGVSGVARKVKQPSRGVNGVSRKVKNVWRGVSGVARQCHQSKLYLYKNGDECTDVTGGWQLVNVDPSYSPSLSLSKQANCLYATQSGSGLGFLTTKKAIDLSKFKTINYRITAKYNTTSWQTLWLYAVDKASTGATIRYADGIGAGISSENSMVTNMTLSMPLKDNLLAITQDMFIGLVMSYTGYIYLYEMWLE